METKINKAEITLDGRIAFSVPGLAQHKGANNGKPTVFF